MIDADRTLLSNELTDAQIHYQRLISTILLIKAIGGGWDSTTVLTPPPDPLVPPYLAPVPSPAGMPESSSSITVPPAPVDGDQTLDRKSRAGSVE